VAKSIGSRDAGTIEHFKIEELAYLDNLDLTVSHKPM
jgi:hypothetical protein